MSHLCEEISIEFLSDIKFANSTNMPKFRSKCIFCALNLVDFHIDLQEISARCGQRLRIELQKKDHLEDHLHNIFAKAPAKDTQYTKCVLKWVAI